MLYPDLILEIRIRPLVNYMSLSATRRPTASIEGEIADSLTFSWSLPISSAASGCPYARYSMHKADTAVVQQPNATDLIASVSEAQAKLFVPATTRNITISDGDKTYAYQGFDSGPHHEVFVGGVSNGRAVIHKCSGIQYLNTSIYLSPNKMVKDLEDPIKAENSVIKCIKTVLEKLVENYEASGNTSTSAAETGLTKEIRAAIHANNKLIIENYWYPILDKSVDPNITLPGFSDFIKKDSNAKQVVKAICDVYKNQANDFFIKIDQFSSMFMLYFIPGFQAADGIGRFISYKTILGNVTPKPVDIRSISLQPGARSLLPITSVVMLGMPNQNQRGAKMLSTAAITAVAAWPETPLAGGQTMVVSPPPWIPSDILVSKDIKNSSTNTLDPEAYKDTITAQDKSSDDTAATTFKLGNEYCRTLYNFMSLQDSVATISTLLDVTWEPGRRYSVVQRGENILFKGFLRSVEHRISSNPSRVEAITQLVFSHVEAEGFTLPNQ